MFGLEVVLLCFIGVILGNAIGVLPGIGPMTVLAILLPVSYSLHNPILSLVLLSGIYYGSAYGETLSSVLTGVPGEISTAIINDDVVKLTKLGRAKEILIVSAIGSFIAGIITTILIYLFSGSFYNIVLLLGAKEYVLLLTTALVLLIYQAKDRLKSLSIMSIGILLGLIGFDSTTGINRFDFGVLEGSKIPIIILVIGCFGLVSLFEEYDTKIVNTIDSLKISFKDTFKNFGAIIRGTVIGIFGGLIPGINSVSTSAIAYYTEKHISRDSINAIASVEASNNAHHQASMIPLMFLGIPTNGILTIILTSLIILGVSPSKDILTTNPQMFYTLIGSMILGNLILLISNIKLINIWIRLLKVPKKILYSIVFSACVYGVYSINNSLYDLITLFGISSIGYYLKKHKYDLVPILVGLIIGPMLEENLRRALMLW